MAEKVPGGFGLYIHWPFCQAKCPYCDFNSHVSAQIDEAAWERAYLAEIDRVSSETEGRLLETVFFGGGTPSMMSGELVGAILDRVRARWSIANDAEITLEANPTSAEASRFAAYRAAGVNRVSMGLQALDDADLRALGRLHSVEEARRAFGMARETFERVSFDLIYARQDQSLAAWEAELREALGFAADHLSLYQLTIEEGTAFGDRFARGRLRGLPDEDVQADMYALTQEMTAGAGLPGYEISNHAAPGAESRHNLIYWRGGDYAGIGPGAHGRLTLGGRRFATETPLAPLVWLRAALAGNGESLRVAQDEDEIALERLMMGLRIGEGVELEALRGLRSDDFSKQINGLSEDGLLDATDGRLRLTPAGKPLLNAVLRALI